MAYVIVNYCFIRLYKNPLVKFEIYYILANDIQVFVSYYEKFKKAIIEWQNLAAYGGVTVRSKYVTYSKLGTSGT